MPRSLAVFLCGSATMLFMSAPARAASSNSLMDVSPDGKRLLVANPDHGSVTVVDTVAKAVIHTIHVGNQPQSVAWVGAGPLALVTVYRDDQIAFIDTAVGKVVHRLDVADEPYGIVVSKDGRRAWVTHDYPGTISEIDVESRRLVRSIPAGSFTRGIALTLDETRLYVTEFYSARLLAVDLAAGCVVDSWAGQESENLCRSVMLHPTRPKAYLSHNRSRTHIFNARGSIFPVLAVCDLAAPTTEKRRTAVTLDTYNGVYVVTNTWESAVSPDGKRLYTIYSGTDDMNVSEILDDGYREIRRAGEVVQVGRNPRGVRVSPDGETVYVYQTLDYEVGVYSAATLKRQATIAVCLPPRSAEWVRGNILFHSAKSPMSGPRWVSCSSCHPGGQQDGRVWQNPEGPRKTPALFGLAHTHPLHASADRDEVQDFEYTIRGALMQGRGLAGGALRPKKEFDHVELDEPLAGRSADLDALATFTNSFAFALSPHIRAPGKLSPEAERGKQLFFSPMVGCATCHSGPYYTDSRREKPFNLHDVGTGDDPAEKLGPKFDTPTLLGVYRTAPYLHHGKAKTLLDVLKTFNADDRHGKTSHLTTRERDDLVAFLKALPYEAPPDRTPNTVPKKVVPDQNPAGPK